MAQVECCLVDGRILPDCAAPLVIPVSCALVDKQVCHTQAKTSYIGSIVMQNDVRSILSINDKLRFLISGPESPATDAFVRHSRVYHTVMRMFTGVGHEAVHLVPCPTIALLGYLLSSSPHEQTPRFHFPPSCLILSLSLLPPHHPFFKSSSIMR